MQEATQVFSESSQCFNYRAISPSTLLLSSSIHATQSYNHFLEYLYFLFKNLIYYCCVYVWCVCEREQAFKYVCRGQSTSFRGQLPHYILKTQDKVRWSDLDSKAFTRWTISWPTHLCSLLSDQPWVFCQLWWWRPCNLVLLGSFSEEKNVIMTARKKAQEWEVECVFIYLTVMLGRRM